MSRGYDFWASIATPADAFLLRQIRFGFRLRWNPAPPDRALLRNQPSAFLHTEFVSQEIQELLAAAAVSHTPDLPYCVFALGVVPTPGSNKLMLTIDMRYGTENIADQLFRLESLSELQYLAHPSTVMLAIDPPPSY